MRMPLKTGPFFEKHRLETSKLQAAVIDRRYSSELRNADFMCKADLGKIGVRPLSLPEVPHNHDNPVAGGV